MMFLLLLAAACLPVDGDTIRAVDLARALPEFAGADGQAVIALSPSFGVRRQFGGGDLQRVAARLNVPLPDASAWVCFERPSVTLEKEQVSEALRNSLGETEAKLEVLEFARFGVPVGSVEFPKRGLQRTTSGDGTKLWRGRVSYGNHRSYPIWARIRVSVTRQAVVATADIVAGAAIAGNQVEVVKREMDPFEPAPVERVQDVLGRIARRGIRAGNSILAANLTVAPMVQRGEEVEVSVHSGAAQLRMTGRAQKQGKPGEIIPVKNTSSGRTFPAKVDGKGRVVVEGTNAKFK